MLHYIGLYWNSSDIITISRTCKDMRNIYSMYLHDKITSIQRLFRHYIKGREYRKKIEWEYRIFIWKCKSFQIKQKLDGANFRYNTNRKYVQQIYKKINTTLHQDSDDEEDYSPTPTQLEIIQYVQIQPHVYKRDITKILYALTLSQLEFI
jgi:hypothetical protein